MKGRCRIPQSRHFNARGSTPEDEIPTQQDFNAGYFNATGFVKRDKGMLVLHFFLMPEEISTPEESFNAKGFQRQTLALKTLWGSVWHLGAKLGPAFPFPFLGTGLQNTV